MSLIKPQKEKIYTTTKVRLDQDLLCEIQKYCQWAGIKDINYFFEEASQFVLNKDMQWRKAKKDSKKKL